MRTPRNYRKENERAFYSKVSKMLVTEAGQKELAGCLVDLLWWKRRPLDELRELEEDMARGLETAAALVRTGVRVRLGQAIDTKAATQKALEEAMAKEEYEEERRSAKRYAELRAKNQEERRFYGELSDDVVI